VNNSAAIFLIVIPVILFMSCKKEETVVPAVRTLKIAVVSDPHYYDPSLGTTGEAFEAALSGDRKMLGDSKAIFEEAISEIKMSDAEVVLLCGDLTKDGERINHEKVAFYLSQLSSAGKKVFVVPGNHDINNPHASQYSGKVVTPVPGLNPSGFEQVYAAFGFQNAISKDPNSLSYVAEAAPGYWILAMDACRYPENTGTSSKTGGRFSAGTLSWILSKLDEAKKNGITVIGMMHHGLTEHFTGQSELFPDYVVEDWKNISAAFADRGLKLVFTGHYHAQDITRAAGTGSNFLLDCETSSLVTSPCAYRLISYDPAGSLTIHSKKITSIAGNAGFELYARDYMLSGIQQGLTSTLVAPPYNLSQANVALAAPVVASTVMQHYQGDELMEPGTAALIQLLKGMGGYYMVLASSMQNMATDLPPADNELVYPLK
jgi:predicted phosphodiesterase